MEPLRDPLAKEDESLPSYAGELKHQEEVNSLYKKHVADKIRKELEIPDATDDEALTVLHGTQVPDSNPEEFKSIIDNVYGNDFKIPKMPLVSLKKPSQVGGIIADLPINYYRDLIGIPQGAFEIARGVGKMGYGQLQGIKQTAFSGTPPSQQNSYTQEGQEDVEKGFQHFVRGGAFAAATALTSGLALGGPLAVAGKGFVKTLGTEAALGAGWLGTYRGIREAGKPEVDLKHIAEATGSGALEGAAFGAGTGLVHGAIRGYKLQKTRAALTLKEQHRAEFLAEEQAKRDALLKQQREEAKKSGADIDALENKSTKPPPPNQAIGSRPGRTGPLWNITLKRGKGSLEVHHIVADDLKEATNLASIYAKHRNAELVGEVEPQLERRQTNNPPTIGLRKGEIEQMSLEDIVKALPQANSEQRIALARELDRRPLGTSPYSKENPVDITKNSAWTSYLIKLREKAKANPKDIAIKDELFRAEQNFEQFKKIKAAKVEAAIRTNAADEIEQVRKMSTARVLKKYGHRFPGEDGVKVRAYVLAELRSMTKQAEPHVKENENIIKDLTAEEAKVNELDFIPIQQMNVEELESLPAKESVPVTKIPPAEIVKPRKSLPSQTLLIGRGMNGQVRVEFPDEVHAKLYSLSGQFKRLLSDPNIPAVEKTNLARRYKESTAYLAKKLNLSEKEVLDLGRQYRARITEFVKGHPTYGESGVTLKAPRLEEKIDQASLDPEQLRKLYEASLVGDKEAVKKILPEGSYVIHKGLHREEPFVSVLNNSPVLNSSEAGGPPMRVVNFDPILRRSIPEHTEFAKMIVRGTKYRSLAYTLKEMTEFMSRALEVFDKRYKNIKFAGFSTYNHFGMNVEWESTGISGMYLNPWRISRVVKKLETGKGLDGKLLDPSGEESENLYGKLFYDYMLHEITHQTIRFKNAAHELKGLETEVGRAFDRELRRNMERMATKSMQVWKEGFADHVDYIENRMQKLEELGLFDSSEYQQLQKAFADIQETISTGEHLTRISLDQMIQRQIKKKIKEIYWLIEAHDEELNSKR